MFAVGSVEIVGTPAFVVVFLGNAFAAILTRIWLTGIDGILTKIAVKTVSAEAEKVGGIFSFLSFNSSFHTSSLSQEWVQMNEENHPPTMAVVIVMVITISVAIGLS